MPVCENLIQCYEFRFRKNATRVPCSSQGKLKQEPRFHERRIVVLPANELLASLGGQLQLVSCHLSSVG